MLRLLVLFIGRRGGARLALSVVGIALGVALGYGVHLVNRAAVRDVAAAVRFLEEQVRSLSELVVQLQSQVVQLQAELAKARKNSGNSSKPPSSDIVKPPPPTGRPGRKRKRRPGGQPGHRRHTRPPFPPERVDRTWVYEWAEQDSNWKALEQHAHHPAGRLG
jgi:hypothetical protein